MRFGLSYDFRNPAAYRRADTDLYAALLDQIVAAEGLGFDEVWLTEHHFTEDGYNPSVLPTAAAIAARTSHIRIGTFVLVLPFHDPVRVAEDATCVDIVSGGRMDLGVGMGYTIEEFAALGIDRSSRARRLEEGVAVIRRLWSGEPVTFDGEFTTLAGATLTPKPVQPGGPPLWIGARAGRAVERAARLGANLLTTVGPDPAPAYREALAAHGRDPDGFEIGQLRLVFCAATEDEAWRRVAPHLHESMRYYGRVMAESRDVPGDEGLWRFTGPDDLRASGLARAAAVGTPDQVAARLEHWLEGHHCTQVVCNSHLAGMDPAWSAESNALVATEVIPRLR